MKKTNKYFKTYGEVPTKKINAYCDLIERAMKKQYPDFKATPKKEIKNVSRKNKRKSKRVNKS